MATLYPTYVVGVPGPREVPFTVSDRERLDNLSGGALLPPGGNPSNVLIKNTASDYDVSWANVQSFNGTLSALGQPVNYVPTSDGVDGWDWAPAPTPVVDYNNLDNLPTLGTASASAVEDFAPASHTHSATDIISDVLAADRVPRLLDLNDVSRGTSAPAGGVDGDWYLQYIP